MRLPATGSKAIKNVLPRVKPTAAITGSPLSSPIRRFSISSVSGARMTTATPYRIHIAPDNTGLWKAEQSDASAKKASELLQEDMETWHVFFNQDGFHNHIPHHILALYGTGAGPASLQKGYDGNANYQRPALPGHDDRVISDLQTWEHARKYFGKEQYYPDFLRFFQGEIEARGGWQPVLTKYLFQGDELADDLLVRLYSGFLHPLIQLMYGVEWDQPAIVAEALAQAAVHGNDIKELMLTSEKLNHESPSAAADDAIVELLAAAAADPKVSVAARMQDGNKIRDGLLVRAKDETIRLAARVRVPPERLAEKTAEMFNTSVYVAAAAAVHPPKHPKFDFFLIHHVNASPIFLTLNAQPWIPLATKVRLLEWKIRMDVVQYAARGCPPLGLNKITTYQPRVTEGSKPIETISRLHTFPDDGHAIKLGRAALICQELCRTHESQPDALQIKGDDVWQKVHSLIVDSVEAPGANWVRSAGFEEAWKDIPNI